MITSLTVYGGTIMRIEIYSYLQQPYEAGTCYHYTHFKGEELRYRQVR